jgi:hypothetical protein
MRSINGYGKTIAFVLTVMLPAPSLAADGAPAGKVTIAAADPLRVDRRAGTLTIPAGQQDRHGTAGPRGAMV